MLVQVKAVRPVMVGGVRLEPGDVAELPRAQALDAAAGGRVEIVPAEGEPAAQEPTAKPVKKPKAE